jgi:hypothetical protein
VITGETIHGDVNEQGLGQIRVPGVERELPRRFQHYLQRLWGSSEEFQVATEVFVVTRKLAYIKEA